MNGLNLKALLSVFVLTFATGAILFGTAGTIDYWQAWFYLLVTLLVSILITVYLIKNDPELLARRLRGGPQAEQRTSQRVIMAFITLAYLALLVVPALDRRFGWTSISPILVIFGNVLVAVGFYIIFRVYRENTYTSATIEVATDQKVIDTGPYALVRHPMYGGALIYLVGTPVALGSIWGVVPFLTIIPFLIWRLFDEEEMLKRELSGYEQYAQKVHHRLIPGFW